MLRSFISASLVTISVFVTGCGSMPNVQARIPVSIDGVRGHISIGGGNQQQLAPQAQVQSYDSPAVQQIPNTQTGYVSESPPCRSGTHQTGWQGTRRVCAPGSAVQQQNNGQSQQNGNNQEAAPCRSGTHQTGWQGTRRVCAPNGNPGQQGGGNFQAQQQQQNSNPSVAHPGFIAAYPGGYQYEGRTYNHQPVNTPTIASKPCRTVYQNGRQFTQC